MRQLVLLFSILFFSQILQAQPGILKSNSEQISITNGNERSANNWTISPRLKPDIYRAAIKGNSARVSFISDIDTISFDVKPGEVYDFIVVLKGRDSAHTRIKGFQFAEPAVFNSQYIQTHNGKSFVEIPPVYELLNIAFAISPNGKTDPYIVYKNSGYYKKILNQFGGFEKHPFIETVDSLLQTGLYTAIKMDAYSFEMSKAGKIKRSKIYDRIADNENLLLPYIEQMQGFANSIQFKKFFDENKDIYEAQIKYYRDTLNSSEMMKWLNHHFPSTNYNSFKIIFTPLVAYNQSATWFKNNGFKEAQAHINFPWPQDFSSWSQKAATIMRGNIVFTELNHAFINPEADKPVYHSRIRSALKNLDQWIEKGKPAAGYASSYACFNEYMNWGLVSLRYIDLIDGEDLEKMLDRNSINMKERRGFRKFPEFNSFLTDLYLKRGNKTIADLYPDIIEWFEVNSVK